MEELQRLEAQYRRADNLMLRLARVEFVRTANVDLEAFVRSYPELGRGDLQIDTANVVVEYGRGGLTVLAEGDDLESLAKRFGCLVDSSGPVGSLVAASESAANRLDRLLTTADDIELQSAVDFSRQPNMTHQRCPDCG